MAYSASQQAAVKATIEAVSANVDKVAVDFFMFFLKKNPSYQDKFSAFKGKPLSSLTSDPAFAPFAKNVVTGVLDVFSVAGNAGSLAAAAKTTISDHTTRNVGQAEYEVMFANLVEFLGSALGGKFDATAKAGFESAAGLILNALKA